MRSLGRSGLRELIERNCHQAKLFADRLRRAGFTILNDVVLNQVLVSFGTDDETRRVIAACPDRRNLLVRRNPMARPSSNADQRLQLGHHQ